MNINKRLLNTRVIHFDGHTMEKINNVTLSGCVSVNFFGYEWQEPYYIVQSASVFTPAAGVFGEVDGVFLILFPTVRVVTKIRNRNPKIRINFHTLYNDFCRPPLSLSIDFGRFQNTALLTSTVDYYYYCFTATLTWVGIGTYVFTVTRGVSPRRVLSKAPNIVSSAYLLLLLLLLLWLFSEYEFRESPSLKMKREIKIKKKNHSVGVKRMWVFYSDVRKT